MNTSALVFPAAIVSLIFGFVVITGLMTVKSSFDATQTSIELLKMHIKVAQMHKTLSQQSYQHTRGYTITKQPASAN